MTTPKTAQQINDPQTGHVSTSRHSALSELMIQNAELREQLRVLQSAYDSLSQMKEKQVASRIDTDELKEENANMKNDLALWAKYFDKQWPKDVHETIERLKAENARLAAALVTKDECIKACRLWMTDAPPKYTELIQSALNTTSESTSLRNLLAPTIELLEKVRPLICISHALHCMCIECRTHREVSLELARLRGLV